MAKDQFFYFVDMFCIDGHAKLLTGILSATTVLLLLVALKLFKDSFRCYRSIFKPCPQSPNDTYCSLSLQLVRVAQMQLVAIVLSHIQFLVQLFMGRGWSDSFFPREAQLHPEGKGGEPVQLLYYNISFCIMYV